ncbi:MAG TPA: hypothetical protein VGJ54_13740 [Streptosporangiaceae bacterium]
MVVRRDRAPADGTLGRRRTGVAGLPGAMASPRRWPRRRWLIVVGAAALFAVAAGLPTDVIPNPLAHREVPVTWWSYPALAATALLGGMLAATYVRMRADRDVTGRSAGGGLLPLLATGCPACNKLVVLLVGTSGALRLWAPVQPVLAIASIVLLALMARLAAEHSCPVPTRPAAVSLMRVGRGG